MSEKVLFFDRVFGTWFRSDFAEIQRMQDRLNQQLRGGPVSLKEYIDIFNENLPEDKRIVMNAWGHYDPYKKGDKIGLMLNKVQTKENEDGSILITFDVM